MCTLSHRVSGRELILRSTYRWPDITGLEKFKGIRVHSANWDHSHDYSHKRIGVIGNGSSGVQIVPQMAKLPGTTVTNFARGPSWIYYRVPPSQHLGNSGKKGNNPKYTEEEKKAFRENPELMRDNRRAMINRTNKAFKMVCSEMVQFEQPTHSSAAADQVD
jgi:cation diffusion facilitator CzcD-associated flavoprotein CzcO